MQNADKTLGHKKAPGWVLCGNLEFSCVYIRRILALAVGLPPCQRALGSCVFQSSHIPIRIYLSLFLDW